MRVQRYFLTISYHGRDFSGWQVQPGQTTVQGVLSDAFRLLYGATERVVGAGRTDSGVHGVNYVAHVNLPRALESLPQAVHRLNRMLPSSVVIHDLRPVHADAHARFSCLSRSYEYRIARVKNPFERECSWFQDRPLDADVLHYTAASLVGEHDFSAFAKADADHSSPLCTVFDARWEFTESEWRFYIRANRFLRNMVRALVGTQVEASLGTLPVDRWDELLKGGTRSDAGLSAPAHGLFFTGAEYPTTTFLTWPQ